MDVAAGLESLQVQGHGQCNVRPIVGHKLGSSRASSAQETSLIQFHRAAKQNSGSCKVQTPDGNAQFTRRATADGLCCKMCRLEVAGTTDLHLLDDR